MIRAMARITLYNIGTSGGEKEAWQEEYSIKADTNKKLIGELIEVIEDTCGQSTSWEVEGSSKTGYSGISLSAETEGEDAGESPLANIAGGKLYVDFEYLESTDDNRMTGDEIISELRESGLLGVLPPPREEPDPSRLSN